MAGLFSRLKIWAASETVTNTDLNNEFNNILANVDATHASGFSSNIGEMQTEEDPGGLGSENLVQPISTAQEIERLRFVISRLQGTNYWYQSPAATLATLNNSLTQAFFISPSRIISGLSSANSSQPKFLKANGAGGVTLLASAVDFNAFIDNALFTLDTDVSLSGLSSAIASGNTATLADNFSDPQKSREAKTFNISSAGTEFSANIGRTGIFKITNGINTEYFMGTVASATQLTGLYRGYLFDTSQVPSLPITLTTGHTITILRMTYIFLNSGGYLVASYNPLRYGSTTPSGAAIGDYWFDETVDMWKTYTGTAWVQANAIFIGVCAQEGNNTVVSRSNEFYHQFNNVNDVLINLITNTTVTASYRASGDVSVYGSNLHFEEYKYLFDITSDLIETEQASTTYYLYLTEIGKPVIASIAPILRKDLKGYYHPYETWRCLGSVYNNASSNLDPLTIFPYSSSVIDIYSTTPTVQKFLSGTALTYTTPSNVKYIRVRMVGAGAGGSSGGTSGTDSTFGSSILIAGGGVKGSAFGSIGEQGGSGGVGTINIPAVGFSISGGSGGGGSYVNNAPLQLCGGDGGSSYFGGGGGGGAGGAGGSGGAGSNGSANSGSGGGGNGSGGPVGASYCGGGAGAFIEATITAPLSTYLYTVGVGGTGSSGGNGGSGIIIVEEFYI